MQPIDTAWDILKARRGAEKREMDRMIERQRQDETMGDMRDPFDVNEEDDLMDELNPRRDELAPRPAPPASPAKIQPDAVSPQFIQRLMAEGGSFGLPPSLRQDMMKPDPVSPEFIQQLMAEGGSFGLPPKLQQAAEEMRRKEMADKLIGMG